MASGESQYFLISSNIDRGFISFYSAKSHTICQIVLQFSSHLLRFQINRNVKKEEIKARLVEPGIIEVEWPRKIKGEDIPVE